MRCDCRHALLARSRIAILLLACIGVLGCQTYTTGLQQSQARGDETTAIAALRTIALAQRTYAISNGGDYGTFQQLCEGGYLDSRFNAGKPEMKGYVLSMNVGEKDYSCNADPTGAGLQAGRHFYIDSSSTDIHMNPSEPASATDPLLQ